MTEAELKRYTNDLLEVVRKPSPDLVALKSQWRRVCVQDQFKKWIEKKRGALDGNIEEDDPIRLSVDLLTPIGCIEREVVHTRAIAYMLDPDKPHGFKKALLLSLVKKIQDTGPRRDEVARILQRLNAKKVSIRVTPEYRCHSEKGFRNQCDVWIKIGSGKDSALIIIENKINAPEGDGQLLKYGREAAMWRKQNNKGPVLLIYLTSKPRPTETPEDWINFSYRDLAAVLRSVWLDKQHKGAVGRTWLGIYIAAVMRGVLGVDIDSPAAAALADIEAYLGRHPLAE